jgi:GNAT superfamily N-acetyltransferase
VTDDLVFETSRIDAGVAAALVVELLADLAARYDGPDPFEPSPHELAPPHGTFVVAHLGGRAVGCGGIRRHEDGVAELKRMYTRPAARRRGVARALLARLEADARGLGYRRIILETGIQQPEAIALYEGLGYLPREPYGQYRDFPDSRFFEKAL